MRKVIGSAFLSLDGVMQAPGGPTEDPTGGFAHGGWVFGLWDEEVGAEIGRLLSQPYDLLLGRRTYDIFAGYWPYVGDQDGGIGPAFTAANKYVLTRGGADLDWANSHAVADMAALAELKRTEGPDLLIQGSSEIYPALLAAGLLDRLTCMIYPVVLGTGKRLFGEGTPPMTLRAVDQRITAAGTIIATYEPAGEVRTGSPPSPEPSERELGRRRLIEAGRW